jgi:hypothetical protein
VTAALTWLHVVDDDLDESIDGPPHTAELDRCTGLDTLRTIRLSRAEQASTLLLLAALGPGDAETRLANAGAVLDESLAYKPGCTAANGWCHAPEHAYPIELDSCSMRAGKTSGDGVLGLTMIFSLALFVRRRRRQRTARILATIATIAPAVSRADATNGAPPCVQPSLESAPPSRLGLYGAAGGAFDHTAINVSLGGRLWLSPRWLVGIDAELNPWMSFLNGAAEPGALNLYGTLVRRWLTLKGPFDLRTTLHLGSSTILFDLFGVPKYSTGIYLGANLLGVEWRPLPSLSLVIDPADVAFPVPQLRGTPFGYLQYRLTVGLQWGA